MAQPGSPGSLRLLNADRILGVLLASGPGGRSRAEIARTTGLSKPTVSALVAELEDTGLTKPATAERAGPVGRPGTPYSVAPDAGFVLAADIGASTITLGIADLLGTIRAEREFATGPNAEVALAQVVSAAADLQRELGCAVHHACAGVPGIYRQGDGVVGEALNLPGLNGMRVAGRLNEAFGVSVHVDNDVNLAARGEASALADGECPHFVAISIGTGIGAGLVLNGELYRGSSDAAGEIGALAVPLGSSPGEAVRTLEEIASAPGIERTFREALADGVPSGLDPSSTVHEILAATQTGDRAAEQALDMAADAMALAVAQTSLLLNPDRIVFGGDTGANPVYVAAVGAALGSYTSSSVNLVASTLGRRATFVGAVMHAVDSLQRSIVRQRLGNGQPRTT
ncbi:MAG: ROK family transcriptional regulator [Actinomycetota bacterium]